MNFALVLCAAGKGTRLGLDYNKVLYRHHGEYLLNITLKKFLGFSEFKQIIVIVSTTDKKFIEQILVKDSRIKIVVGGTQRQFSVKNGVEAIREQVDYVFVHDAARPNITQQFIASIFEQIKQEKLECYVVGTPLVDTIRRVEAGFVKEIVDREHFYALQTPQIATLEVFKKCYKDVTELYTDESALFLNAGYDVKIIDGEMTNIKVTHENDLRRIE